MDTNELKRLEYRIQGLEQRLDDMRALSRRILGIVGAVAAAAVLIAPFFVTEKSKAWIWTLGGELAGAGTASLSGTANMAGVVAWFILGGTLAGLVALLMLSARTPAGSVKTLRILLSILSVGTAFAWILMILLDAHFDRTNFSYLSPGPVLLLIATVVGWCAFPIAVDELARAEAREQRAQEADARLGRD